jgi:hypothetical protein
MSRVAAKIERSADETDELNRWIKSGKTEQRKVERAKIVLRSAEGKATHQIAKELGTRPTRVSKWRNRMRKHDLHLDRRQSWCVSTDPEFSRKASEIVGLYLNPPENAIVLSVDEKPSIQALERAQGYIRLPNGRAVSGFAHEYKRHARRRFSRRSKPPLAWLRAATTAVLQLYR